MSQTPQPAAPRANTGLAIKGDSLPLDSNAVLNPAAGAKITLSRSKVPRPGWYVISGMTSTSATAVGNNNMRLQTSDGQYLGTLASRTNVVPFTMVKHIEGNPTVDVVAVLAETGATYYVDSLVVTEIAAGEGR